MVRLFLFFRSPGSPKQVFWNRRGCVWRWVRRNEGETRDNQDGRVKRVNSAKARAGEESRTGVCREDAKEGQKPMKTTTM